MTQEQAQQAPATSRHSPEPWRVRPYDLKNHEPVVCEQGGEAWATQSWAIVSAGSSRQVAEVRFATNASDWSPVKSRSEAIANRDRIVACVNACAGLNPDAVPGLVEALERLAKFTAERPANKADYDDWTAVLDAAEAALAAAKGGAA